MKTTERILEEELMQLKKIVENARKRLETAPLGRLRITRKQYGVEYYYKEHETNRKAEREAGEESNHNGNGRYMRKSELNLVKRLAQRDYDKLVVKRAEERIRAIECFREVYDKTCLKNLYRETNSYRKELITPVVISDEEFVKQWQAVEYKGKTFEEDENIILTERGERVRSKSEKIIADKLYSLGIPYRYEYPLMLAGGVKVYPDFTILRMPMREEVYLEHFGMMDDPEYADTALYKLGTYEKNGIYLGVNLFLTYETGKKALNTKGLDGLVRKLFCEE
ncbi:MAG: hypothetical protein IKT67_09315 [Lachnospiraceae bacterium]|nr:hypothetical protein [Lachnospiraceae bacterium]